MKNYIKQFLQKLNLLPTTPKKSFNELTKEEQIVAVAEDVIQQVNIKRYKPNTGKYIYNINLKSTGKDYSTRLDVKSNFEDIESCQVCALGACLMSATKFKNVLTFEDTERRLNNENAKVLFKSIFSPDQLFLIETAYEGYARDYRLATVYFSDVTGYLDDEMVRKVYSFRHKYQDDTDRLVAIMKNIIENKGTFIL